MSPQSYRSQHIMCELRGRQHLASARLFQRHFFHHRGSCFGRRLEEPNSIRHSKSRAHRVLPSLYWSLSRALSPTRSMIMDIQSVPV